MRASIQVPAFDNDPAAIGPTLSEVARAAEDHGFDTLWVMDHLYQIGGVGPVDEPMLEAYTTLGFVAGVTSRIRLGTLVTAAHHRQPGVLAKAVTSLDVLSAGRAWLGIGAGWFERESRGLGLGMPTTGERFDLLEDALQLIHRMWDGDRSAFAGRTLTAEEPICSPPPLTSPHPPILIGGAGEKRTLRLVAEYADACNFFSATSVDVLAHKLAVLERHCADVGRDPGEIERTLYVTPGTDDDALGERLELGFSHLILPVHTPEDVVAAAVRVPEGVG